MCAGLGQHSATAFERRHWMSLTRGSHPSRQSKGVSTFDQAKCRPRLVPKHEEQCVHQTTSCVVEHEPPWTQLGFHATYETAASEDGRRRACCLRPVLVDWRTLHGRDWRSLHTESYPTKMALLAIDLHMLHKAWVGDMWAARRAGRSPATAPMTSAAASPPAQAWTGMTTDQCCVVA